MIKHITGWLNRIAVYFWFLFRFGKEREDFNQSIVRKREELFASITKINIDCIIIDVFLNKGITIYLYDKLKKLISFTKLILQNEYS